MKKLNKNQNEDNLKKHKQEWARYAVIQHARDNEKYETYKAQREKNFNAIKPKIKDDKTARQFELTHTVECSESVIKESSSEQLPEQTASTSQKNQSSTSQTQSNNRIKRKHTANTIHLAFVAQGCGWRVRRENNKNVFYQQDKARSLVIPECARLSSREVIHCLKLAYAKMGEQTAELFNGTTATLCIVTQHPSKPGVKRTIWASLGDSFGGIYQNGVLSHATVAHHPSHPAEVKRIQQIAPQFDPKKSSRLIGTQPHVDKQGTVTFSHYSLAMSRSFGNKNIAVSSHEPTINVIDVESPDAKCFLSSDGCSDVLFAQEIAGIIKKYESNPNGAVDAIRQLAYQRAVFEHQVNKSPASPDNTTVMLGDMIENAVYLILDGHGPEDTCVNTVADGNDNTLSLLEYFKQETLNLVNKKQNHESLDLPEDIATQATLSDTPPSLSQSLESTLSFSRNSGSANTNKTTGTPPADSSPSQKRRKIHSSMSNCQLFTEQSGSQQSSSQSASSPASLPCSLESERQEYNNLSGQKMLTKSF